MKEFIVLQSLENDEEAKFKATLVYSYGVGLKT